MPNHVHGMIAIIGADTVRAGPGGFETRPYATRVAGMYAVVRMERGVASLMFGRRHLHKVADAVIEALNHSTVRGSMITKGGFMSTRFPDITVSLLEQTGKPVAQIAMVRRALQKAGHDQVAREFTTLAFAAEEDEIVDLARQFVTVT